MKRFYVNICIVAFIFACSTGPVVAAHSVDLSWTKPTLIPAGSYINIYRGTAAGTESATPINISGIDVNSTTYTDNNVAANGTYYYTAKQCAIDNSTQKEVCSAPSNEAPAIVSMTGSDLGTVGTLSATPK